MKKPLQVYWRSVRRRGLRRTKVLANRAHSSRWHVPIPVDWTKVGLLVLTVAGLSFLMSVNLIPDRISLRLGDVSPREVRANRSVTYIDVASMASLQQAAMIGARPVFDTDDEAAGNANHIVLEFFDQVENARSARRTFKNSAAADQAADLLQAQLGSATCTRPQMLHLLTLSPSLLQKLRETTVRLVGDAMDREIREPSSDLSRAREEVARQAMEMLSPEDGAIVQAISRQALRPNRFLNRRKTELSREAAAHAVGAVYSHIQYGDKVIGKGERVTQDHLARFTALGLRNPHIEPTTGVAICILAAAMVLLVVLTIGRTLPALYADRKRLALLATIVLLGVVGLKVGAWLLGVSFSGGQGGQAEYIGMMSVAAAGMLVSVLLDRNLAVLIVALLAIQSGLIMNHEMRFTIMSLMGGLVGILSVGSVRRKNNFLTAVGALAGANLGLVWLLGLLLRDSVSEVITGSVWAVLAAVLAIFLFWFGVLVLEKPFGILTHTALLELSTFERPLLSHLCAVAPGTYAHSVMVGTIAEAGAQTIGADALLCRVSGYYHDIGKSKNPEFFVENQRRENVHCRLSPSLSALIIISHVRDGIELATAQRLPSEITDIIAQHHGTTLIRYFYHQALTDCSVSGEIPAGMAERFRYPGPKPQTREAALVMLADSVEAAARSLEKPSREQLGEMISAIFSDKIEDGQLDDCDLTFRDLKRISDAFLHVLTALMHGRIEYPKVLATGAVASSVEFGRSPQPIQSIDLTVSTFEGRPREDADIPMESVDASNVGLPDCPSESIEMFQALTYLQTGEACESASADRQSPLAPLVEPEVLYGRPVAERQSAPDPDHGATPGSPPRPRGGRPRTRRG